MNLHEEHNIVESSSAAASDDEESSGNHEPRVEFPWKIHQLLKDAELNHIDPEIISWLPCGRVFKIHSKIKFEAKIMPAYFSTSNYKSFHRNLNLWGFVTAPKGVYKGVKYNRLFVRDHPERCHLMKRVTVQGRAAVEKRVSRRSPQERVIEGPATHLVNHDSSNEFARRMSSLTETIIQDSSPQVAPSTPATIAQLLLNKLDADLALSRAAQIVQPIASHHHLGRTFQQQSAASPLLNHHYSMVEANDIIIARAWQIVRDLRGSIERENRTSNLKKITH